jgi:hypothetical protein
MLGSAVVVLRQLYSSGAGPSPRGNMLTISIIGGGQISGVMGQLLTPANPVTTTTDELYAALWDKNGNPTEQNTQLSILLNQGSLKITGDATITTAAELQALLGAAAGDVTSVTGSAPIVSSGGQTPAISITAASDSAAGSMSAVDKTKLDTVQGGTTTLVAGVSPSVSANLTASSRVLLNRTAVNASTALGEPVVVKTPGAPGHFVVTAAQSATPGSTQTGDLSTFDWLVVN